MVASSVLIDCDPGIDDALALLFAFASFEIEIEAITVIYGNADVSNTLENLLKILHVANIKRLPDIGKGCEKSLKGLKPKDRKDHGSDGLAEAGLALGDFKVEIKDAIDLIIEKTLNNKINHIIALGPLTNLATAILKEPRIKKKLRELIIMGGILYPTGSFGSTVEFNIGCDPEAAEEIFHSGIPIKLISLDITQKVILKEEHLRPFEEIKNPLSDFVIKITRFSIDFNKKAREQEGAFLHDPLAVGAAVNQQLYSFEDLCIEMDLKDERGRIYLKKGKPHISFCKEVKTKEFLSLFINRLLTYCKTH